MMMMMMMTQTNHGSCEQQEVGEAELLHHVSAFQTPTPMKVT